MIPKDVDSPVAHGGSALLERCRAPAKINLWLEVIRRRGDGYHELSSLMVPLQLCDDLKVQRQEDGGGISIECDEPGVPLDEKNLCWKAARSFLQKTGLEWGVHIALKKRIPHGAGLGGGSSDAAATLLALNRLARSPLQVQDLHDLARSLGADVPFFLYGRPALATGIGDRLEPVGPLPPYRFVLIKPPFGVATGRVYESLTLTRGESRIRVPVFLARPWDLELWLQNDLETVTENDFPIIRQLKQWLMSQGARGALMSGSGSTVFGVFEGDSTAAKAVESARKIWTDCWIAASGVYDSGPQQHS